MEPDAGYYPNFSDGAVHSTNYADHRQIPAYLLTIHSLKPNKQRVLGAYSLFLGILTIVGKNKYSLVSAINTDRFARVDPVPIAWDYDEPAPIVEFLGNEYEIVTNEVLGIDQIVWTDIPKTYMVEMSVRSTSLDPPSRPESYYIPGVWSDVIDRLTLQGIDIEVLDEDETVDVVRYRFNDFKISDSNREGRATASVTPSPEKHTMTYKKGDAKINADQLLVILAVSLVDPLGESSFFYWGFFNSKFTKS
jgi:hypothetical protein